MANPVPRAIGDNAETRRFLDKLSSDIAALQSAGALAPLDASYVTLGTNGTLTSERVLTPGGGLAGADGGAGSAYTLSVAAGAVLQCLQTTYATNADLTTAIPNDDSTPTNSEGTEVLSLSITPAASANKILILVNMFGSTSLAGNSIIASLFRGSTCIQVSIHNENAATQPRPLPLNFLDSPSTTSATTYSVRVGPPSGTARLNGTESARLFGGTATATLTLMEIKG